MTSTLGGPQTSTPERRDGCHRAPIPSGSAFPEQRPARCLVTVEKQLRHLRSFQARCWRLWSEDIAAHKPDPHKTPWAHANQCSRDALIWFRPGLEPIAIPMRCKRKWCPVCSQLWAADLLTESLEALERIDVRPRHLRHIVLTVPNAARSHLRPRIAQLYKAWREWRNQGRRSHRAFFWESVAGYRAKLEITCSPSGSWHPHLHILAHCPKGFEARRGDESREAWVSVTKAAGCPANYRAGVYVTAPKDSRDAAREVAKYAAKPYETTGLSAPQLRELASATHGVRFASANGTLASRPPIPSALGPPHKTLSVLYRLATTDANGELARELAVEQLRAALVPVARNPVLASRVPAEAWDL